MNESEIERRKRGTYGGKATVLITTGTKYFHAKKTVLSKRSS